MQYYFELALYEGTSQCIISELKKFS